MRQRRDPTSVQQTDQELVEEIVLEAVREAVLKMHETAQKPEVGPGKSLWSEAAE